MRNRFSSSEGVLSDKFPALNIRDNRGAIRRWTGRHPEFAPEPLSIDPKNILERALKRVREQSASAKLAELMALGGFVVGVSAAAVSELASD